VKIFLSEIPLSLLTTLLTSSSSSDPDTSSSTSISSSLLSMTAGRGAGDWVAVLVFQQGADREGEVVSTLAAGDEVGGASMLAGFMIV
jgi:hypothetical protein